jgi:quinol monooxygenase YgiN
VVPGVGGQAGQIDVARNLILEMVESTQNEPGALMYEGSISDDETAIHSNDRYADSDAVLEHLSTFGERFAERFLAALNPTRIVVYGRPTDRAREGARRLRSALHETPRRIHALGPPDHSAGIDVTNVTR